MLLSVYLFVCLFVCYFSDNDFNLFALGCSLSFATDFPDKEPVLLSSSTSGYSLILPTNDAVKLKAGQKIVLSCPGGKNTITASKYHIIL